MFCPKCGKADQSPETYCRQCGVFLPDLSKPVKKGQTPEEHVLVNLILSGMTIVACFTLAILLYSMLAFRENTHPLIYATASVLIAMGAWHIQALWRSIQLRRHFKKAKHAGEMKAEEEIASPTTGKFLDHANFENMVPPSVTDRTTKHLVETKLRSS